MKKRLRRNCSEDHHFEKEAKELQVHLKSRGYSNRSLKKAYIRAKGKKRASLIHNPKSVKVRMITSFSGQHRQVRDILQKHWYLLMGDDNVSKNLNQYPKITFRRSRSLRDSFVHSHYTPQIGISNNAKGTRPCHKCNYCQYIHAAYSITLPNGCLHKPKFMATCQLFGMVYIMLCECHAFYVGKTKRPFYHRIRDDVSLVSKKIMETPISRHMGLLHHFDCSKMHFFALKHIPPGDRGGDYDKILLQREARWIHELSALKYPGLNDAYSFKSFL